MEEVQPQDTETQGAKSQRLIRVILTTAVILTGAYYIQKSSSIKEMLSNDAIDSVHADFRNGK